MSEGDRLKPLDRVLQEWRIAQALPHIPRGARVLDVGAHHGELLFRIGGGVGIDPHAPSISGDVTLLRGTFPDDRVAKLAEERAFDVVTMLAVFEHVRDPRAVAKQVAAVLAPLGRFVLTVPDAKVDRILDVLLRLKLVDGMSADEEHHGFDVRELPRILDDAGFDVVKHARFQIGLNNLFVAVKR